MPYTHLGCFGAQRGAGGGAIGFGNGFQEPRRPSQLGRQCQFGLGYASLLLGSLRSVFHEMKDVYD
jgi:hypothetical protein